MAKTQTIETGWPIKAMADNQITISQFAAQHSIITHKATLVDRNPNAPDWSDADHWRITLVGHFGGQTRRMTTYFSMGHGHEGREPSSLEILDALASDSAGSYQSFEEWADEYGYDPDSRKAEATHRACKRGARRLRKFLGQTAFDELLDRVERL